VCRLEEVEVEEEGRELGKGISTGSVLDVFVDLCDVDSSSSSKGVGDGESFLLYVAAEVLTRFLEGAEVPGAGSGFRIFLEDRSVGWVKEIKLYTYVLSLGSA